VVEHDDVGGVGLGRVDGVRVAQIFPAVVVVNRAWTLGPVKVHSSPRQPVYLAGIMEVAGGVREPQVPRIGHESHLVGHLQHDDGVEITEASGGAARRGVGGVAVDKRAAELRESWGWDRGSNRTVAVVPEPRLIVPAWGLPPMRLLG